MWSVVCWQADWLVGWLKLAGLLADWLASWLRRWMAYLFALLPQIAGLCFDGLLGSLVDVLT